MNNSMSNPYISIAFANRNDNYGGDLDDRINKFIDYYQYYVNQWPELFEFVICDWNPPIETKRLKDAFPWFKLGNVKHIEVPKSEHERIVVPGGRKMLDYIARNVAIRNASGEFVLVINQDIFISDSIMNFLAAKTLDYQTVYRADRCDFDFESCRHEAVSDLEKHACQSTFVIHRRHSPRYQNISLQVTPAQLESMGSGAEVGDVFIHKDGIIQCKASKDKYESDKVKFKDSDKQTRLTNSTEQAEFWDDKYYRGFYLHTNASGDFILAPRSAFFEIQGMIEATYFYLHLDSYAMIQLFAAGYNVSVFAQPHRVYHADHDRSGRLDFNESVSWEEHEKAFSQILRGEKDYKLNDVNWGLHDRKHKLIFASCNKTDS